LHQGSLRRVIEADFARLPGFLEKILAGETPTPEGAARTEPPAVAVPPHLRKGASNEPAAAPAASESEPESQQMRLL
jgi:hypothetical protein